MSHKTDKKSFFGKGNHKEESYWMSLIRQSVIYGYLKKEIETYGLIKITDKAKQFLKTPTSFLMTLDNKLDIEKNINTELFKSIDENLVVYLKKLRKKNSN